MSRNRLPNRRKGDVITFSHESIRYTAQVSRYSDGALAEIFLDADKPGSPIDIMAKDMATLASLALQHGVPVGDVKAALSQELNGTMRGPLGVLLQMVGE